MSGNNKRSRLFLPALSCMAALTLAILLAGTAAAQVAKVVDKKTAPARIPSEAAPYAGYKGIRVGMPATEARTKLGEPRDKSDTEDFFVFSDEESLQVVYDPDKTIRIISVNYVGTSLPVPSPKDVFGEDAEAKTDGSVYKMVRYPKAGYWISYNRTAGDNPLTVITMQKMPIEQ